MIAAALSLLRAVPAWLWVVAACLAWGGIQHHRAASAGQRALLQAQAAAAAQANAASQAAAREREAAIADATRRSADAYRSRLAQTRRDADAVRDERDRLLVAVDAAAPACPAASAAATAGGADGAAGLRIVVRECAAALSQVAAAADAADARLSGL